MVKLKKDSNLNVALPSELKDELLIVAAEEGLDLSSLVRKELKSTVRRWKNKRRKNNENTQ